MDKIRNNISWVVAMVVFAVAFLVVYAATHSFLWAPVIALPLAGGTYLIMRGLVPGNTDLRDYDLDSRRRVKKVMESVSHIQQMTPQVRDLQARQSLLEACKIIPQLLKQTQEQQTTSFRVASTAANVQNYLTSVEDVLGVYLRIQQDPSFFADPDKQLAAGKQGFADFEAFTIKSIQQLNAGDTQGYAANLETLRPLNLAALPSAAQQPQAGTANA
jgi:hypothetical protein